MGESCVSLTRSFSQPSPTSSDEKKRNPLQRALTTSVSFGRFMSESLDWERWSTFTHNRHLEEVEKYSKPGSVAEKRAYFEAHYKRRRAAALLEQQNATANDFSERNTTNKVEDNVSSNLDLAQRDNCVVIESIEEEIERKIEQVNESSILVENEVEITNHLENDGEIGDILSKQEYSVCEKDGSTMTNSVSPSDKKPKVSSLKMSTNSGAYKHTPSIKPPTPVRLRSIDKFPISKNDTKDLSNKRRSNASLHMSINFASCSGETRKPLSPNMAKITNSRLVNTPIRKSKNGTSVSGIVKHYSATLPPDNKRTMTVDRKLQSTSTNNSKSSNIIGNKARSTTVSSFTFKSEERVAKRKEFFEKLEQKKSKETEKQQLTAKTQVKARSEFKNRHDSITSKAKKIADIPQTIASPSNLMKKEIPSIRPFSPKIINRAPFKAQDNVPRPPWRVSVKPEGLKDVNVKNNRPAINAAKSFWKKSMCENASPNIQL